LPMWSSSIGKSEILGLAHAG